MSKRPVNLTLDERVLEFAHAVMVMRGQSSLSGFIEELIRIEYERRSGPMRLAESHQPPPTPAKPTTPEERRYPKIKRKAA